MADLLHHAPIDEAPLALPAAPEGEEIVHDYAALGLTLRRHPLALLRERLARRGVRSSAQLDRLPHGRQAIACGLVIGRQQPGTANGTIFVTLEDETGPVNVIVWPGLRVDEAQRNVLLRSQLLAVQGEWQRDKGSGETSMPPRFAASPAALPPEGVLAALGRPGSGQVRHLIAQRLYDLTPLLGRLAAHTTSRDFH
jgi:error-prone DNA polymerase